MAPVFDQEVVEKVYDSALKVIKEIVPHFNPITYECISIVNGCPDSAVDWVNPEVNNDADLKKHLSLAQEYCDDHVKFCLENRLVDIQRSDVLIVITGCDPMNESVVQTQVPVLYWDASTMQIVDSCPDEARSTGLISHCYFLSELK